MYRFFQVALYVCLSISLYSQTALEIESLIKEAKNNTDVDSLFAKIEESDFSADQSIALYMLLADKCDQIRYGKGQGLALAKTGTLLLGKTSYDSARNVLIQAEQILKSENEIYEASRVDFDLAVTYYSMGQFDLAAKTVIDDLDLIKEVNASQYNTLLRTVGEIYRGANNLESAAHYLKIAVAHSKETNSIDGLAYNLNRLGVVYYQDSKHELAKESLEESFKIAQEIGLDRAITMNLNDMGELYFALKDYERCIELYEIALERDMIDGDRANTYNNVARLNRELGNYHEAISYATKAHVLAKEIKSQPHIVDAEKILADSYQDIANFKKATEFYTAYIVSRDSLYKVDVQRQLAEVDAKYQTEKKELEIVNLTEKEEIQRSRKQAYLFGLIILGIFLVLVLLLLKQISANKRKIESQKLKLEELNSTKDKFFSIIAHDLRSPMIGLQGVGQKLEYFIRKNKQEKLLEMGGQIDQSIDQLNHLLNNLLNWATSQTGGVPHNPGKTNLAELIRENVRLYESLAQSKDISIDFELMEIHAYVDANSISTVIRNLLSNAIKFTKVGGRVFINNEVIGGKSYLSIEDEGPGMTQKQLDDLFTTSLKSTPGTTSEKGFGLGLKLCKEFVSTNKGEMVVSSEAGKGTVFTVSLPKNTKSIVGKPDIVHT